MTALSFCLAIHEPYCPRRYQIFDVGESSIYDDDDRSCQQAMYLARTCYLPMNELLFRQIKRFDGDFTFAISISGSALDLFEQYTPEVLDSLKAMVDTGCVEIISESGPHSLACLYSTDEFEHQVIEHSKRLEKLFGKKPKTFRNSELLFNNDLALTVHKLGFNAVLTEGKPEILGWRNSNYLYESSVEPDLLLLLRNQELSMSISQNFSDRSWNEWPLTCEKFVEKCQRLQKNADILNIFLDFHAFGLRNRKESGIFDFMEALPSQVLAAKNLSFTTPALILTKYSARDSLNIPNFISWNDEGSDIRGWLGNEMQKDAIQSVYKIAKRVREVGDSDLGQDYERLQTSDFFHYMSTRWFSESQPDRPNPYMSPYDAYISYMNILSDLTRRLLLLEETKKEALKKEDTPKTGKKQTTKTSFAKSSLDNASSNKSSKGSSRESVDAKKHTSSEATSSAASSQKTVRKRQAH